MQAGSPGSSENRLIGQGGFQVVGNASDNLILGGKGTDEFLGGAGTDTLRGGGGDDFLAGQEGRDWLTGGEGADSFVIDIHDGNSQPADVVMDFSSGTDVLLFPGATDPLPAARFLAADNVTGIAASATPMLYYDTDSGRLWLDFGADSGLEDRLLIAILHGAPTLQASDIIAIERHPIWLL